MANIKVDPNQRVPPKNSREATLCIMHSRFPIQRYICVPNVWWGLLPLEADFLAMSNAGYLTEVEIKMGMSDLKNDSLKHKWTTDGPKKNN